MASKPIRISILADSKDATQGMSKVAKSAQDMATDVTADARKVEASLNGVGDSAGEMASTSAQVAGGIGDIGGSLSAMGIISESTAGQMDLVSQAVMGITGVSDLAEAALVKLKASTIAQTLAEKARTVATIAGTAAQRALNLAMLAGPWILLVAAIAAVVAVVILCVKHWDTIKAVMTKLWSWVKDVFSKSWDKLKTAIGKAVDKAKSLAVDAFNGILAFIKRYTLVGLIVSKWDTIKQKTRDAFVAVKGFITAPITAARDTVIRLVDRVVSKISGIKGSVKNKFGGMFDGIRSAFFSAVNAVIRGWNRLSFTLPSVDLGPLGKFGGFTLHTPDIPYLAKGGIVTGPTLAMIGEAGDEAVIPLDRLGRMGGNTYIIRVEATPGTDRVALGREIAGLIDDYELAGGRRRA